MICVGDGRLEGVYCFLNRMDWPCQSIAKDLCEEWANICSVNEIVCKSRGGFIRVGDNVLSKGGQQDILVICISFIEEKIQFRKAIAFNEDLVDWSNQCVANNSECVRIGNVN